MKFFSNLKLKALTFASVTTVVRLLTGFVSVKIVAVFLGPDGVAIIGNLNNVIAIISTVSSFGIGTGVVKYLSENRNVENNNNSSLISTAFHILLWSSIGVSLIVLVGASFLSSTVLLSPKFWYVFVILAFTIFANTFNVFLQNIFNGFQSYNKMAWINMANGVCSLAVTSFAICFFQLEGALLSIVIIQVISLLVTLWFSKGELWFNRLNFFGTFNAKVFRNYSKFTLMSAVSTLCVPIVQVILRKTIIDTNSLNEAGIWEAINRLSSSYLMIITSLFSIYYLPRLSEIKNVDELKLEIRNAFLTVLPILLIGQISIYVFRDEVIHILFSQKFYPIKDYLAIQLVGDFFKVASLILAYLIVAKAKTKMFVITEVFSAFVFLLFANFLIPKFGVKGAVIAYTIDYFFYFIIMVLMGKLLLLRNEPV